jgi:hypothetical protein
MRARRIVLAAALAAGAVGCGDDEPDAGADPAGDESIEVVVADDTSSIAPLRDVRCRRVDDTQLVADGIVGSSGDATHYVSVTVRFVDTEGVRVEIASDSVSELLVGESARWEASTYADGAPDVRRCEVTAAVS